MLIVGENLRQLIIQENICDEQCYDTSCISLSLGDSVVRLRPTEKHTVLDYGTTIPEECIIKELIGSQGLQVRPHESVIASSHETIHIPLGYFGLLQTKGSLARLFISLHFSDGQIDPGYNGKITFEMFNGSEFTIRINRRQLVGNLFIFKTSTDNTPEYKGRYQNSTEPSIFVPNV